MLAASVLGSAQTQVAVLFGIGLIVTVLIFALVALKSRTASPYTEEYHRAYTRWRGVALGLMVAMLLAMLGFYWRSMPYPQPARAAESRQVVRVDGFQFGWLVIPAGPGQQVRVGVPTEFRVTAQDVNHALGVYDDRGVLLFQVQAMPAYENRILWSFERPGTYTIVCTEFCGSAHHLMTSEITVVE